MKFTKKKRGILLSISSIVSDPETQRLDPICQSCQNRLQKDGSNQSFVSNDSINERTLHRGYERFSTKFIDIRLHGT